MEYRHPAKRRPACHRDDRRKIFALYGNGFRIVSALGRLRDCPAAISSIMFFTYILIQSTQKNNSFSNNITFHRAKFKARG